VFLELTVARTWVQDRTAVAQTGWRDPLPCLPWLTVGALVAPRPAAPSGQSLLVHKYYVKGPNFRDACFPHATIELDTKRV